MYRDPNKRVITHHIRLAEGGFVLCGYTDQGAHLMKVDDNGDKIWAKELGYPSALLRGYNVLSL